MANVLNHLKRGESLENKQLVLINSNEKDLAEQSTSSFTYTFSQPVKRISRMDVMNTKIPKSYYNINNDNATMSITTERFTDTITDVLVVDDVELNANKTNYCDYHQTNFDDIEYENEYYANQILINNPIETLQMRIKSIQAITASELLIAANELFDFNKIHIITFGKVKQPDIQSIIKKYTNLQIHT